jgi:hypothetical protein
MDKMETLSVTLMVGGVVLVGTAIGAPDLGWISAAAVAVIWLDQKFSRIDKKIDRLPCVRGKHCGFGLEDRDKEESSTI